MAATSEAAATSFREMSADDWACLGAQSARDYVDNAGDAYLQMLAAQANNASHGLPVNNYQHSLQCATRAMEAGEEDECVIAALFHDLAQDFFPYDHDAKTAALLAPYLSAPWLWVVAHHQVFQLSFRDHSNYDRKAHLKYRDHPHFERALRFCEFYDQNCFDPDFVHAPLDTFAPMVKRHFAAVMRERLVPYPPANSEA